MLSYYVIYAELLQIWCCQNYALFGVKFSANKSGCVKKRHFASLALPCPALACPALACPTLPIRYLPSLLIQFLCTVCTEGCKM